ncbi:MAG: hypothetical protein K0U38_01510 [Epsilonproteobacteria bacterium]|nr:hypothetical protein [Campylobacterota bacterium]
MNDVVVIMPSIDVKESTKTMNQLIRTAGMEADFFVLEDKKRTGFIKTVNEFVKQTNYKYYVYTAQDSFGGRNWLKLAWEALEKSQKGLFAFNDGKWAGKMAGFGMVRRSWKAPFFEESYKANYADVELTMIAIEEDELVTDLRSLLVEVDFDKHLRSVQMDDKKLFAERKKNGFDGQVKNKEILKLFY